VKNTDVEAQNHGCELKLTPYFESDCSTSFGHNLACIFFKL